MVIEVLNVFPMSFHVHRTTFMCVYLNLSISVLHAHFPISIICIMFKWPMNVSDQTVICFLGHVKRIKLPMSKISSSLLFLVCEIKRSDILQTCGLRKKTHSTSQCFCFFVPHSLHLYRAGSNNFVHGRQIGSVS